MNHLNPSKTTVVPRENSPDEPGARNQVLLERKMGHAELTFYLVSRGEGTGDIFVRLGCRIKPSFIDRERVRSVWAIMRLRHPLLASKVYIHDYDDVRFSYTLPKDSDVCLAMADESLQFTSQSTQGLTECLMNGARTLSDERLSCIIVNILELACREPGTSTDSEMVNCDFFFCATHFVADGMALHMLANDFFIMLGSGASSSDLSGALDSELVSRTVSMSSLPSCLEDKLPQIRSGRFQSAARRAEYLQYKKKEIGGHAFRQKAGSPRKMVVRCKAFEPQRTKSILKNCKSHEVSVSSTLFAVCNFAWARTSSTSPELPSLMRLSHNLRPYLINEDAMHDSYFFLANGLLSVVLPTFMPGPQHLPSIFWHRSQTAKKQMTVASKSPMLGFRCQELYRERSQNVQDEAKQSNSEKEGKNLDIFDREKTLSKELVGLSLLGNLDAVYKHARFSGIQLHSLFAGSRQGSGYILLVNYTFAGKLWVNLRYDEGRYDKTMMETFWENVLQVIDEYLP